MLVVSCVFSKYGSQRCKFVLIKLFLEGVGGSTCSRVTCNRWCNSRSVIFCSGDKLLCSDNDSGSLVQSSSVLCGSFFYRRHVFCFEIHWQLTKAHGKGCLEMIRHPWCDGYLSVGYLEMVGHPWCDGYLSGRVFGNGRTSMMWWVLECRLFGNDQTSMMWWVLEWRLFGNDRTSMMWWLLEFQSWFELVKQHLGGQWFHSKEDVEMVIHEWFKMQKTGFWRVGFMHLCALGLC